MRENSSLLKMMLSSHAGALADSSWTKGFVCSLDKQESSRSLASSLSLSLSLAHCPLLKHKYIYIHTCLDSNTGVYTRGISH